ncbi:metalloregulator ArsR/SmtB family transcription factor [Oceaniserpentilla sp. 4NH20-0058]|uniref:metalloregulator ArsR/SmtB family transcription factor n=1 Tax=Oceaniserpentilla sp. 4NH20-0058 TaxID=3127660 RepID=UPI003102B315
MTPLSLFKCLGDETRLFIMVLIQNQGELNVGELVDALQLSQPKVSRHLSTLRECQLLDIRKSGQWVFYRVHDGLPQWANEIVCQAVIANEAKLPELIERLVLVDEPQRKVACC